MINRHVQVIYCDDIRHEINDKISYIGVYQSDLYTKKFPVILPKLCVAVTIVSPCEKPVQSIVLRILKDEKILQKITLSEEQLKEVMPPTDVKKNNEPLKDSAQTLRLVMVYSPMSLEDACVLRIRVQTEDEELRGLGLRIQQDPAFDEVVENSDKEDSKQQAIKNTSQEQDEIKND